MKNTSFTKTIKPITTDDPCVLLEVQRKLLVKLSSLYKNDERIQNMIADANLLGIDAKMMVEESR